MTCMYPPPHSDVLKCTLCIVTFYIKNTGALTLEAFYIKNSRTLTLQNFFFQGGIRECSGCEQLRAQDTPQSSCVPQVWQYQ